MERLYVQRVEVLASYLFHGDKHIVAKELGVEAEYVHKMLRCLKSRGYVTGTYITGFKYSGKPFGIIKKLPKKDPPPPKPKKQPPPKPKKRVPTPMEGIIIQMSDTERNWMMGNYCNAGRRVAANTLKRTRADICLMALQLGLGK